MIPAPVFNQKVEESAILRRSNPWTKLLQERNNSSICGVRTYKRDYEWVDRPNLKKQRVSQSFIDPSSDSCSIVNYVVILTTRRSYENYATGFYMELI